jgi:hypothetical protein
MVDIKNIFKSENGRIATLVVSLFIGFTILFAVLAIYTAGMSDHINREWEDCISVDKKDGKTFLVDSHRHLRIEVKDSLANDRAFNRIVSYLVEIKRRQKTHDATMVFFYEQYFLFNMLQAFMIMFTTIMGLLVSKYGWEKINRNVLYSFFILAGFVAFVKVIPEFLQIEDNIKSNKKYVIIYGNMEQSVISYLVTGENSKGKEIKPTRYIHLLDKEMNNYNNISFNIEKIPDQDFDFGKKD